VNSNAACQNPRAGFFLLHLLYVLYRPGALSTALLSRS
jgi:hypothetical protein